MKKRSASHDLGTYPSPGAPQYRGSNVSCQKGWASERVPPPPTTSVGGGRQIGSAALMSFNSGRTLPSKWEDAERWICSPVFGPASNKSLSSQPQKRPKSKSGPIVHPATAYYSNHSPAVAAAEEGGGSLRSFAAASSPFSTGVLAAESVFSGGIGQLSRLATIPGWPELRETNFCPSPKKEGEISVSRAVSQRDMANQMSPKDCVHSSNVGRSSFASSPPALLSIMEQQSDHSGKLEVKDVQVDKRATMIRWSRRRGIRISRKGQADVNNDFNENALGVSASSFDVSEAAMDKSKWQREEAKIIAWENLQKAKAEAALRKLEMKLEKKRSATMDKIIDKLKTAQFRAHKMRAKLSSNDSQSHEVLKTPRKFFCFRKHVRVGSLSRFFVACRAF
ncbi:Remorin, C-terminal [Trema orientale]|uniref:Remorin, C-terminal n=1 Tax=Trema orientale TaxID=63057 RepID=A0A2P5FYE3_TREOI|nr:Remorin, C-terminal [Trema orientale]